MRYIDRGSVRCPHCGEWVAVEIDPGGGRRQDFIEDCWVCCRPMQVRVDLGRDEQVTVEAEPA